MVIATRYTHSPIGPYLELSVSRLARIGLRVGFCVTTMVVSSQEARVAMRRSWGMPADLGKLHWSADNGERELWWEDRDLRLVGAPFGPRFLALSPVPSVQRRSDGAVVVPRRFFARTRLARVELVVCPDDELTPLAGRHAGAVMAGLRLRLLPARRPSGALSSLRAPLLAPEPALAVRRRTDPVEWRASGALSSVG